MSSPLPTAIYGCDLLLCAIAWNVLQTALLKVPGNEQLRAAIGRDIKGKISLALYAAAIGLALVDPWIGVVLYSLVACLWLVPDKRFER